MKDLLEQIGLEPARLEMFNMSAAMADEFVARAQEMVARVETAGPNPLRASLTPDPVSDKESAP